MATTTGMTGGGDGNDEKSTSTTSVTTPPQTDVSSGVTQGEGGETATNSDVIDNGMVSDGDFEDEWKQPLENVYKLALDFYKEKDGKAFSLKYDDRLKLVAYWRQVTHGKYTPELFRQLFRDVGYLDIQGNDRKNAWQKLGDMSQEQAMKEFCKTLGTFCPVFKAYVEAHKRHVEEQERIRKESEEEALHALRKSQDMQEEMEKMNLEEEARRQADQQHIRWEQQKTAIQQALNRQTEAHFKAYAAQQFPNEIERQQVLLKQLQEQHYEQYMQQVYQQQLKDSQINMNSSPSQLSPVSPPNKPDVDLNQSDGLDNSMGSTQEADESGGEVTIAQANLWTRKVIKEFKDSIKKDGEDGVIKVGHGETVTVRVPTHEDGSTLFWEFATDHYDIGFGLYFEWTVPPNNTVVVHVCESSDEEEEEEDPKKENVEQGIADKPQKPPTDEIIPVYRRDCHDEVYAGSHSYPGRGIYLLKFDNSYSLWRSKTLYYRVYYTK